MYEQKRQESTKIMAETGASLTTLTATAQLIKAEAKRDTIQGLLTYIEQRLEELEQEKQELKEYQEQDRERRCLEYAFHYRELDDVSKALEQVSMCHTVQ